MTKTEALNEAIRHQEWLIAKARKDLARADDFGSEVSVRQYRAHLKSLLDHYDTMTGAAA
jgi:hypothetical protein